MEKIKCISCGYLTIEKGYGDPRLCRDCEEIIIGEEFEVFPPQLLQKEQ